MRTLVLGGTHHVGRCFVEAALTRGHDVVTLHRGRSGIETPGVDVRHADRLDDDDAVARALGEDTFDSVVDTWSWAPRAVLGTVRLLSGRADHYTYVSSRSVYVWPPPSGADESAAVVDGDPDSTDAVDYAAAKRGGELAAAAFAGSVALLRAGLVLGPYEIVGRLPFWLRRIERGGRVPVPGPPDRPLQLIDARDLAGWVLDHRPVGTYNTVSRPGHTTMGALLEECVRVTASSAELVWLSPGVVAASGVSPWTELPIWTPPTGELAALHAADTSAAHAAGLRCRPVAETVADTWAWLRREGIRVSREDRPPTGMDQAGEARLWAAAGQS